MESRGFSIRETARRASIHDKKRFYRWATKGIARAAHDHDGDLYGLQRLFGLRSFEELWGDPPEVTLEDRLLSAAAGNPHYGYAYKLLKVLHHSGKVSDLCQQIDAAFIAIGQPDSVSLLTPEQVIADLKKRCPQAYTAVAEGLGNDSPRLRLEIATIIARGVDPVEMIMSWWEKEGQYEQ
jgi:hypothetical protein